MAEPKIPKTRASVIVSVFIPSSYDLYEVKVREIMYVSCLQDRATWPFEDLLLMPVNELRIRYVSGVNGFLYRPFMVSEQPILKPLGTVRPFGNQYFSSRQVLPRSTRLP